jgi:hypothetical protein
MISPGTRYVENSGTTTMDGGAITPPIVKRVETSLLASAATAAAPARLAFHAGGARSASFVLELPRAAALDGRVFDTAGREVARIVDVAREAGVHTFALDGSSGAAARLASGIYFGRIVVTTGGVSEVLKARVAVVR